MYGETRVIVTGDVNIGSTIPTVAGLQAELDLKANITALNTAISDLKNGVPLDGDTLKKLNDKIIAINTLLGSDNVNLDNLQELVDAIEALQTSLSTILVDDLTTGGITKALTAQQGVVLKGLIDTINGTLTTLSSASHTHSNKALLDTYTQTEANIADAVSKKHTHSNQVVLDATTASFTTADETKLDGLVSNVTHTGDVTGATALTITNDAVTNAKLSNMANSTIKGRVTTGAGDPEDLTASQVRTIINVADGANNYIHPNHTGDVTSTGDGATVIANNAVTLAKMADVATGTLFYRKTAGTGDPETQTLATLKTDLGLTGTNSGDQTSIVGITGTKAQFNTAVTDGDFMYVGDAPTAHTHTTTDITNLSSYTGLDVRYYTETETDSLLSGKANTSHTHTLANVTDVTMTVANLNSLDDGVNSTLHFHNTDRDRANHTGTQTASTISDFNASSRGETEAMLVAGTNITLTPSGTGATRQITIASTGGGGGGSGDVVGPASATDNAIVRFDTTTGKLIQNSSASIDDNGIITASSLILSGVDAEIEMQAITNEPGTPASGRAFHYVKSIAGRIVPKFKGPSGLGYPLQSSFWQNNITMWNPTTATAGVWIGTAGAGTGTYSTALPTTTNLYTATKRGRWANVVTTTNQVLGQRNTEAMYFRGSVAGQGGFFFYTRCGFDVWTNGGRFFAGMHSATTVVSADPSALNNTVGFCVDAADNGAISFLTRGTVATKASTGFTITSNKGYDLYIFCAPNSSQYTWRIVDFVAGTEASGTATANLPTNTTLLTAGVLASNGALTTVTAIQLGVNKIYIETDH